MEYYFVDKNARKDGCYEVHRDGCWKCPIEKQRIYVGYFSNGQTAKARAGKFFDRVNGCPDCSRKWHIT